MSASTEIQFVPWVRSGVGALPGSSVDDAGRRGARPSIALTTTRDGLSTEVESNVEACEIKVLGPGDVVGIDVGQVLRRSPRPDEHNLEPNYLALMEFDRPDFPWMFSLSPAEGTNQHDPWLMLVVLELVNGQDPIRLTPLAPCPVLTIADADSLPNPANAWAFAHTQVVGISSDAIDRELEDDFRVTTRSRILCPTQLKERTAYLAALIPTYEVGRLAGLGKTPSGGAALWSPGVTEFPVYDHWRFHTGPRGSFELLAERLHRSSAEVAATLGIRRVAVEPVASGMHSEPSAATFPAGVYDVPTAISFGRGPNGLKTALSVGADPGGSPASTIHQELKNLVDQVAGSGEEEPIVGPPLYGQWPAMVTSLDGAPDQEFTAATGNTPQTWVNQINADPSLRVAAGAATLVVQQGQEALMAQAWKQLDDVISANIRIRWSRLASVAMSHVHSQITELTDEAKLRLTAPAAGRLRAGQETVLAALRNSTVPIEAAGPALTRASRYAVRHAHAPDQITTATTTRSIMAAFRDGSDVVLPRRVTDPAIGHRTAVDPQMLKRVVTTHPILAADSAWAARAETAATVVETGLERVREWAHQSVAVPEEMPAQEGIKFRFKGQGLRRIKDLVTEGGLSPAVLAQVQAVAVEQNPRVSPALVEAVNRDLLLQRATPLALDVAKVEIAFPAEGAGRFTPLTPFLQGEPSVEQVGRARVGAAEATLLGAMRAHLGMPDPTPEQLLRAPGQDNVVAADLGLLAGTADLITDRIAPIGAKIVVPEVRSLSPETVTAGIQRLEPDRAYGAMLTWSHEFSDRIVRRRVAGLSEPVSPFTPAMAAPLFPAALVDRLRDLDQEWVLGGVGGMEPNTLCVLEANRRFVESFLAGANHEMARELLWRGYPTDLRGTCFPRFWNGAARDIRPMDRWTGDIGEQWPENVRQEITVVVIKGDLLRRYPNTVVTAERGVVTDPFGTPSYTAAEVVPEVFRGFLGEDVTYVGLGAPLSRISADLGENEHWFISLAEPYDEARFGLDPHDSDRPPAKNLALDQVANQPFRYEESTRDWTWEGLNNHPVRHLVPANLFGEGPHEGNTNSAVVGAALFRQPFRVLLNARDFLPL